MLVTKQTGLGFEGFLSRITAAFKGREKPLVLIIDDDEAMVEVVKFRLSNKDGFDVETAATGVEGRDMASQLQPDLILMDWRLPDISGLLVLKTLRGQKSTTGIPVIMYTGKGLMGDAEKAIGAGAFSYITKPITMADLSRKLQSAAEELGLYQKYA